MVQVDHVAPLRSGARAAVGEIKNPIERRERLGVVGDHQHPAVAAVLEHPRQQAGGKRRVKGVHEAFGTERAIA
jgi:hypothetical protein